MYDGSCLCGEVKYRINCEPKKVSHCHCSMCQKQHGSAFATYASFPKVNLDYRAGRELLTIYKSSDTAERKFCSRCGSNIEWVSRTYNPEWVSIALSTLDTAYRPELITNIYPETAVCWLSIA